MESTISTASTASASSLSEKSLKLILQLSDYNRTGSPFIKEYTTNLAKLLGFIVNRSCNETLEQLMGGLENVLLAFMPDITELFVAKTLEHSDYNGRNELLRHINGMVSQQVQYPCNIEGTMEILNMVMYSSAI